MRILPSLLVLALALGVRLPAQTSDFPTTTGTIAPISIVPTIGTPAIDLRNYFQVTGITGQVVQFTTPGVGVFNVEMNATAAPNTVANFLSYVNAGSFTNSLIHRSIPGVIQGGSFLNNPSLSAIPTNAPINMETSDTLTNVAGTISMARTSDLNSATSGWFINVADNSGFYRPASANDAGGTPGDAGSYAVFGRVTGTGMTVVNAIAALPLLGGNVTVTSSSTSSPVIFVDSSTAPANFGTGWWLMGAQVTNVLGNQVQLSGNANANISTNTTVAYSYFPPSTAFSQIPVFTNLSSISATLYLSYFVTESTITAVPIFPATPSGPSVVTFSAASSNPNLVGASVSGSMLNVVAAANLSGIATVTVTATDSNGNAVSQTPFSVTVIPEVANDFNGDSTTDLVWQNSATGTRVIWFMNKTNVIGQANLGVVPTNWRIAATGDFNGDGKPDIVWQDVIYGTRVIWFMNGSTYLGQANLGVVPTSWNIAGVGDFNGDGKPDIVWRNTNGSLVIWFMNGTTVIGQANLGVVPTNWNIATVADFNGDGKPDIVWEDTIYGTRIIWFMNGTTVTSQANLGVVPTNWSIAGVGDFDGDGNPDLIWQDNVYGTRVIWFMNGTNYKGQTSLGVVPTSWQIKN